MAFEGFKGGVPISSGIIGPNDRDIPLVYVRSIQVGQDSNNRLDDVLDAMQLQLNDTLPKAETYTQSLLTWGEF